MNAAPEQRAVFTTRLITTEVGFDPSTGDIWYYTGGIAGTMVKAGTVQIPPFCSSPPVIIANTNLVHGSQFTLNSQGTWNTTGGSVTFQWYSGSNPISGAVNAIYTSTASDVGNMLSCVVTRTNTAGSASAPSNSLGPIT